MAFQIEDGEFVEIYLYCYCPANTNHLPGIPKAQPTIKLESTSSTSLSSPCPMPLSPILRPTT